ncbi:MAG: hypothetical protein GWN58_33485 [Anaerolineae bacterium]|nr:hypothetical protein [Thermoplasmata archaeon]NIV34190.1 hypothetical protein [Anaerolineae bacterium]NIY06040.1 hypothetical protein [Thermoplasmata archaeon]
MGTNSASAWQKVRNHRGKVIGRMRRVCETFEADQRWEVEGLEGVTFEDWFDAQGFLLENDGMRYVVKTELSHRFWTGTEMGPEMDRSVARVYAREIDARKVADQFDTGKSWDRVCVAVWRADGFGQKKVA